MGVIYYSLAPELLETLRPLIRAHEADPVGPRARGYWFDYPADYNYEHTRSVAGKLDATGRAHAVEVLELSEVQAHSLSLLEVELPREMGFVGGPFAPALFLSSLPPKLAREHVRIAERQLGGSPEHAVSRFAVNAGDPRVAGYIKKQVRHLREALPQVWRFYERAAEAGLAVLVVDLRARDLFVPSQEELAE